MIVFAGVLSGVALLCSAGNGPGRKRLRTFRLCVCFSSKRHSSFADVACSAMLHDCVLAACCHAAATACCFAAHSCCQMRRAYSSQIYSAPCCMFSMRRHEAPLPVWKCHCPSCGTMFLCRRRVRRAAFCMVSARHATLRKASFVLCVRVCDAPSNKDSI